MIVEFIFSSIFGLIVGMILSWFWHRLHKKKISDPNRIKEKLEKQDKVFYVDGKKFEFNKQPNAEKKIEKHIEDLKKEEAEQVYKQTVEEPPTPIKEEKTKDNSFNKILGRK